MKKTSSELYNKGIEILRNYEGGTDIIILTDLYRLEPSEYAPGGKLGADILVEGKKIFLGFQEVEDIMVYGESFANRIMYEILK